MDKFIMSAVIGARMVFFLGLVIFLVSSIISIMIMLVEKYIIGDGDKPLDWLFVKHVVKKVLIGECIFLPLFYVLIVMISILCKLVLP